MIQAPSVKLLMAAWYHYLQSQATLRSIPGDQVVVGIVCVLYVAIQVRARLLQCDEALGVVPV